MFSHSGDRWQLEMLQSADELLAMTVWIFQLLYFSFQIPAMQKRVITPYPGAPDLSVYEDEDLDSAFSPKPEAELDHSCRYTNRNVLYFLIVAYVWLYCNAEFCIFILSVEKLAFFKYFKLLKSSAPDRYVLMMVPHYPSREILLKKAKMKAKKKPRRRSDSSGGYTLSDIIQSPPAAGRLQTQTQVIWFWNTSASGCWWVICYNYTVFPLSGLTAPSEVRQGELYRVSAGAAHIWFWGQLHGSGQSQRHSITHLSWQSWGKYLKFNETDMHTGCCQCIIKKISKQIFNLCLLWFFGIYMDRWIWYYRSQEKLSFIICRMKRLSVRG